MRRIYITVLLCLVFISQVSFGQERNLSEIETKLTALIKVDEEKKQTTQSPTLASFMRKVEFKSMNALSQFIVGSKPKYNAII